MNTVFITPLSSLDNLYLSILPLYCLPLFRLTPSSHHIFSLVSHLSFTFSDAPPTVSTQGSVEGSHLLDDSFMGAVVLTQEDATGEFPWVVLIQSVQQWHVQVTFPCKLTVHKWTELQINGQRMEGEMENKVSFKACHRYLTILSHYCFFFLFNYEFRFGILNLVSLTKQCHVVPYPTVTCKLFHMVSLMPLNKQTLRCNDYSGLLTVIWHPFENMPNLILFGVCMH